MRLLSRDGRPARRAIAVLVALLVGSLSPATASGEESPRPTFTAGQCRPDRVSRDLAPRARCGTVAVPRDDLHPDRGTFNLAVVVVASATRPAQPDPDLYISGGPGAPLTVYADAQARRPLASGRDLMGTLLI